MSVMFWGDYWESELNLSDCLRIRIHETMLCLHCLDENSQIIEPAFFYYDLSLFAAGEETKAEVLALLKGAIDDFFCAMDNIYAAIDRPEILIK